MSRQFFEVEKGLSIVSENADTGVKLLFGANAPGGATETDGAEQGSIYCRTNGEFYQKNTSGTGTDKWVRMANLNDITALSWRPELVRAATGDVAPTTGSVINLVTNPFGDDEGTTLVAADFVVGEHILFGVGGTPKLMRVSVVSAPNITVVDADDPLTGNDSLMVRNYLPDATDDQEKQALVLYNGSAIVKLADFNWDIATGINLSSGYAQTNGTLSSADTVETAIEKLDGNQIDLTTLSGVGQGSVNLGTFTGATILDNRTTKQALQDLETAYEETDQNVDDLITLSGVAENATNQGTMTGGDILTDNSTENALFLEIDGELTRQRGKSTLAGVTTITTLDSVLVDDVSAVKYLITIEKQSAPGQKRHVEFFVGHNGHASGDATVADSTEYAKLKIGSNFNYSISVDLNGVTTAQTMRLRVASTEPGGINVYAKRIEVLF